MMRFLRYLEDKMGTLHPAAAIAVGGLGALLMVLLIHLVEFVQRRLLP